MRGPERIPPDPGSLSGPDGKINPDFDLAEQKGHHYFAQILAPTIEALRAALDNGTDDEVREAFAAYKQAVTEMRLESNLARLTQEEEGLIEEAQELTRKAHEMKLD